MNGKCIDKRTKVKYLSQIYLTNFAGNKRIINIAQTKYIIFRRTILNETK